MACSSCKLRLEARLRACPLQTIGRGRVREKLCLQRPSAGKRSHARQPCESHSKAEEGSREACAQTWQQLSPAALVTKPLSFLQSPSSECERSASNVVVESSVSISSAYDWSVCCDRLESACSRATKPHMFRLPEMWIFFKKNEFYAYLPRNK